MLNATYCLRFRSGPRGGGGGEFHIKQTGMLFVSLRDVDFGFWSRLGCSGERKKVEGGGQARPDISFGWNGNACYTGNIYNITFEWLPK